MKHLEMMTSECCFGCSACMAVCPRQAIRIIRDEEGFYVPSLDEKRCIDCGKCHDVCQAIEKHEYRANKYHAFAVRHSNEQIRKMAASGGFFQGVAGEFIRKGGYVCGVVLDDMKVRHIISNKMEDIYRMADSKYVQSDLGNSYQDIADLLNDGKEILFSGTSCQNAGLKEYLALEKVNTDRLLCIDFFCHGVPSPLIWDYYVAFLNRKKRKEITGFRWRCKDYGWGVNAKGTNYLNTSYMGDKKDRSLPSRSWRHVFFSNMVLRRVCSNCPYRIMDKPGDITMGDFWMLNECRPDFNDGKGTSCVIAHDEKYIKYITSNPNLEYVEVSVEDAIKGQALNFTQVKPHPDRALFWKDLQDNGVDYAFKKHLYNTEYIIKSQIKWLLFKAGLRNY